MKLPIKTAKEIEDLLVKTVREKLKLYKPETVHMPFHHRLLGKDKYAMFSFIQSVNTSFGISIWEQVAVILGERRGAKTIRQYKLLGNIDSNTEELIQEMHYKLRKGTASADKFKELESIRKSIKQGKPLVDPDSVIDLFIMINKENYFDITSAKPNMKEFVALKLKLLRWTALRLSQAKKADVFTRLAIPYNPYYPGPYDRWTLRGLFDLKNGEVLVGEEFWNFIAGKNIYEDLLNVFQRAGKKLRQEIDKKFAQFKKIP